MYYFMYYLDLVWLLVPVTGEVDCLERSFPEMTCYKSSGTLNSTYSLTHFQSTVSGLLVGTLTDVALVKHVRLVVTDFTNY